MTTTKRRVPRRRSKKSPRAVPAKIPSADSASRREAERLATDTIGKRIPIHAVALSEDGIGSTLTSHRDHPMCRAICQTKLGQTRCADCYRTNLETALRKTDPHVFVCHAGLTNVLLPIGNRSSRETLIVGRAFTSAPSPVQKKTLSSHLKKICGDPKSARLLEKAPIIPESDLMLAALIARNLAVVQSDSVPRRQRGKNPVVSMENTASATSAPPARLVRHQRICQQVAAIIENGYAKPLSVARIAASVNLTPNYLCSVFHKTTRATLSEHISNVRVRKSQQLLAQPHLHIKQVAYQVGFTDPNHFAVVFKKVTGQTPTEWRASHDEKILNGASPDEVS